jgi:type II secretory pathway component PulF
VTILSQKIEAGERLGDAFIEAGFSPFECHLAMAGERSGKLDVIFEHLAAYWSRQLQMKEAIIRPLIYPIVVMHLAIILGSLIELATMPWPVVMVHLLERLGLAYVAAFVLYLAARFLWTNELVRRIWLRFPIVGNALSTTYAYRWITALRLEFTAGVSLISAVGDAWRSSGYMECDRFAVEGEQAMREGVLLSTLIEQWKRLPRDWIDFVQTAEISGAFEETFITLEAEAAYAWKLAQDRMAEWLPKILYFIVLIIAALQVGKLIYQVEIAPIVQAENQNDNLGR